MDIAKIGYTDRVVDILNPLTGEKLGITVTVMSYNDPRMAGYRNQLINQQLKDQRMRKFKTAAEIEDSALDLFCALVVGWDWGENEFKGKKLDFSTDNLRMVLKDLTWFKTQLDEAIGDERGFFTN